MKSSLKGKLGPSLTEKQACAYNQHYEQVILQRTSACIFSIHFSINFLKCYKENLLSNQELPWMVIISFVYIRDLDV